MSNASATASKIVRYVGLIVVAVAMFQVMVGAPVAFAGRITLRSTSVDPSQLPQEWRAAFTMLAAVVEDDDFQDSLREYLREASEQPKADYCRISAVVCDDAFQIVALNLSDVHGSIAWQAIPKGLSVVHLSHSVLKEAMDLTMLPHWIKVMQMENVTFLPGGTARFRKRQSVLHTFSCVRCNLKNIQWNTVPSLTHLDLAGNPLQPVDFGSLPPTLRYLNLSDCNAVIDALSVQSLPPPLTVVDLSHNQIRGSISTVMFPSGVEVLRLQHNLIEGELLLDNLPFALVECDVSHNKLHGTMGDMSSFLSIQQFRASHNAFSAVMFDKLPAQLEYLDISSNFITGALDVTVLPSTLTYFNASGNQLSGSVRLPGLHPAVATFDISHNKFTGPIDLTQFSENMRFAYIQHNLFEGVPDLTNLPVFLRRILIHDNHWDSLMPPMYL